MKLSMLPQSVRLLKLMLISFPMIKKCKREVSISVKLSVLDDLDLHSRSKECENARTCEIILLQNSRK